MLVQKINVLMVNTTIMAIAMLATGAIGAAGFCWASSPYPFSLRFLSARMFHRNHRPTICLDFHKLTYRGRFLARRRRRSGLKPVAGTGWMAPARTPDVESSRPRDVGHDSQLPAYDGQMLPAYPGPALDPGRIDSPSQGRDKPQQPATVHIQQ